MSQKTTMVMLRLQKPADDSFGYFSFSSFFKCGYEIIREHNGACARSYFLAFTIICFKRDVFVPSNTKASHGEYETHRIKGPKCFFKYYWKKYHVFLTFAAFFEEQKENIDRVY